jgi:hypothetical protein
MSTANSKFVLGLQNHPLPCGWTRHICSSPCSKKMAYYKLLPPSVAYLPSLVVVVYPSQACCIF